MYFSGLTVLAFLASIVSCAEPMHATAYVTGINPNTNGTIHGTIQFSQQDRHTPTHIFANITGLTEGDHGIHIHQSGDLSGGCATTGAHYNPFNRTHGGLDNKERHVGDLGNIVADQAGQAFLNVSSDLIFLSGKYSVIGRAVVVHSGQDDLGLGGSPLSNTTGNSGERWACGVIGYPSA
ncbi:copper/zinc superoxide dismutase [Gilbertella persicaria]|uniref:copper/zinc superoxide dismutase n=1 Tax=Gilbertella persicaria TaxID=101096 RepID=UPI0022210F35|nr:copper/zinc superoxide dismutase [Gilbertella persicaria]KAI8075859.1 copper/zinc superoxide dismutase [Gilbertella persicaria]